MPKHRTRHRFWSPESHPNCYWLQLGSFVDTPWWRHSRVHPCSARALWGIILRTAKVSEKLCFHSQKTSHFEKQWWPADNPKCVSAHDGFETNRTLAPLTSLCVCCALHGCAVDGIFLGTFVVERWTLPRRGHQLPHLPRGPLFSGVRPRAAWHGRSDPARRARGITPGTSLAIAPGADACALVGAAVTCHGALRALARGTQETRVVGCWKIVWKCWCLFCTSNCRNADSSRIAPPLPQGGPTLAALPAQQ